MNNSEDECEHCIIMDLIDIDPDRSQIIYYCEKCMTTFDCSAYKKQQETSK